VQAATDVAIAAQMAKMLRSGAMGNTSFSTIVAVGHSYGSIQINALTAQTPAPVDHVVLTGFSANATHFPAYLATTGFSPAHAVLPHRFGDLPSGYLVTAAPQTFQLGFLFAPGFSAAALRLARATEQPVAQGVVFTILSIPAPAPAFTGSVAVVTGRNDFVFCAGDCLLVPAGSGLSSIPDGAKALYPGASNFTTYLPENTGYVFAHMITLQLKLTPCSSHAISVQYSAGATYRWIQQHIASL
jgi:pimeloyl-ACP methyl ester carboxylesterase